MSNYTKTTDFEAKDSLPTGDSGKIIRGSEFETEFDAISTAIATKADTAGPTFTGTLTFETISDGSIGVTAFVDEDDMVSDSATLVPTQQSVKAYVDSQVTAQDLDFQGDTGGALSIDLDSESLTVAGGTGIDTAGAGNTLTVNIDSTVATLTGTQTLTNKTLTAPTISGDLTTDGTIDGRDVAADGTKLDGIESGATADQTAAEIRTLVESATDSNVFTDADHTKLDGIEANATADQTAAEIRTLVDSATDSNVFTDADHTKLDGIEAGADVTDTTNVTAAGAVMDSELTSEASVKALDQGVATTDSPTFAGLTTTADVSFGDNDKAVFGAGSDLQIYHTGSASFIDDAGSGDLNLRAYNDLNIKNINNDNIAVRVRLLDGSEYVELHHAGSTKLATTSTGIDVTGTVTADGLTSDGGISIDESGTAINITNGDGLTQLGKLHGETTDGFVIEGKANNNLTLRTKANTAGEGIKFQDSAGDNMMFIDGTTGDISFYEDTGTTAKLFWDASAESLGIGTSSPSNPLEVAGGSSYPTTKFSRDGGTAATQGYLTTGFSAIGYSGGTGADTYMVSEHGFGFAVNAGTTAMTITDGGNVGIGTSSPSSVLHAKGGSTTTPATASAFLTNATARLVVNHGNEYGAYIGYVNSSNDAVAIQSARSNGTTGPLSLNTFGGNVGIGTSSPDTSLHISEPSTATATLRLEQTDVTLVADQAVGVVEFEQNDASGVGVPAKLGAYGENPNGAVGLRFYTGTGATANERMRIDSSGNVGIGTSSPSASLSVETSGAITSNLNSTNANGGYVRWQNSGTSIGDIGAGAQTFSGGTAGDFGITSRSGNLVFGTGSTERLRIDSSGNLLVGTTSSTNTGKVRIQGPTSSGGDSTVLTLHQDNYNVGGASLIKIGTEVNNFAKSAIGFKRTEGFDRGAIIFCQNNTGDSSDVDSDDEVMRIDSSGNVGIGNTSPDSVLTAVNAASTAALRIGLNNTSYNYMDADNNIFRNGAGTERMRIDSSGHLLVGTTDSIVYNEGSTGNSGVVISSDDYYSAARKNGPTLFLNRQASDGAIAQFYKDGTSVGSIGNNTDFYIASQDGTGVRFTSTQVLPCSESGAIQNGSRELGSTSARFKNLYLSNQLDVTGSTTYAGYFSTSYDYVAKFESTDSAAFIVLEDNASTADGNRIGVTGDVMEFETAGSEAMRINSSGNLLIGTTSTTPAFSSTDSGIALKSSESAISANNAVGLIINRNTSNGDCLQFRRGGTSVGSVSVSGTNATFNTSSDQRLKDNIVDAPSASDDIDAIQVRSFDWKVDGSHQKYGMVAQELQTVAPNAVTGDADSDEMMAVDYSKLVPMLVKEIQSLRARVAQLEGEN